MNKQANKPIAQMAQAHNIIIAGAGGIGRALGLILTEYSEHLPMLFIGDRRPDKARQVSRWIHTGALNSSSVNPFHLAEEGINEEMREVLEKGEILLDCLPGSQAPRMARLARTFNLHYANLTEYVSETNEIVQIAEGSEKGFLLQTGLAPGFVNVLGHGLFQSFCRDYGVERADYLGMKVGALTCHATAPHYYGFTWSPIGVATEYIEKAVCLREYKKTLLPSLSEREIIYLEGQAFEADLTSGGAADLPDTLEGKVGRLDYKTIRYPGHYRWVEKQLQTIPQGEDRIALLRQLMLTAIPHIEKDLVVIFATVEGPDQNGILRRKDKFYYLESQRVGNHVLRAIQTTTAAPLAEAAQLLLQGKYKGVVFQSMLDPESFLNGRFVKAVYWG